MQHDSELSKIDQDDANLDLDTTFTKRFQQICLPITTIIWDASVSV